MRIAVISHMDNIAERVAKYIASRFLKLRFTVWERHLHYPVHKFCEVMGIADHEPLLQACYASSEKKDIFIKYLDKELTNRYDDFTIVTGIKYIEEAISLKKLHFSFIKVGTKPFWSKIQEFFFLEVKKTTNLKPLYNDAEYIVCKLADDYL